MLLGKALSPPFWSMPRSSQSGSVSLARSRLSQRVPTLLSSVLILICLICFTGVAFSQIEGAWDLEKWAIDNWSFEAKIIAVVLFVGFVLSFVVNKKGGGGSGCSTSCGSSCGGGRWRLDSRAFLNSSQKVLLPIIRLNAMLPPSVYGVCCFMKTLNLTSPYVICLLMICGFVTSCATGPPPDPHAKYKRYLGQHSSRLIAEWGPPNHRESDGKGGQVWVYMTEKVRTTDGRTVTKSYEKDKEKDGKTKTETTTYRPPTTRKSVKITSFFVDANGYVYDYALGQR